MMLKRLIEILKTFDKEELKRFGRFIDSNYFNTNERIHALFRVLKKYYPQFDSGDLTNEYLFGKIYSGRDFDEKTIRYLLSVLLDLAEKFIAFSFIEKEPLELNKLIINALMSRKLFSQSQKLLKQTDNRFDEDFIISSSYIFNKLDYLDLWKQLFFLTNKQESQLEKRIEQSEYLTFRTFIELCNLTQSLNVLRQNLNTVPGDNAMYALTANIDYKSMLRHLDLLEKDITDTNRKALLNSLKIFICYLITFFDEKDEEYFYKLKDLVEKYANYFAKEELQNVYVMLLSCCNLKRKTIDSDKYIRNYFEVVKSGLSKGLFVAYEGQYLDVAGYYRMFQTALYLKEYEWAESFADRYLHKLSPEFISDLTNYSRAELDFYKKEFDSSLSNLAKVGFSYNRLKLNVRLLTLMIYYEKDFIEEAFSLIDSFTHLLSDSGRFNTEIKELSLNFITFVRDMLKYKTNGSSSKKLEKLRNELSFCRKVEYRNWLLEKAEEL